MPPSGSYSCINTIQSRADTGKNTPTAAVFGEMAWRPAEIKQWKCITANWARFVNLETSRVNNRIFHLSYEQSSRSCKHIVLCINVHGFAHFSDISSHVPLKSFPISLCDKMVEKHSQDWEYALNSRRGNDDNKLRTYRLFKSELKVDDYCKIVLPLKHRSVFAKFRCGVAQLRIETGPYENLSFEERLCPFCNFVEDEIHVMFVCSV